MDTTSQMENSGGRRYSLTGNDFVEQTFADDDKMSVQTERKILQDVNKKLHDRIETLCREMGRKDYIYEEQSKELSAARSQIEKISVELDAANKGKKQAESNYSDLFEMYTELQAKHTEFQEQIAHEKSCLEDKIAHANKMASINSQFTEYYSDTKFDVSGSAINKSFLEGQHQHFTEFSSINGQQQSSTDWANSSAKLSVDSNATLKSDGEVIPSFVGKQEMTESKETEPLREEPVMEPISEVEQEHTIEVEPVIEPERELNSDVSVAAEVDPNPMFEPTPELEPEPESITEVELAVDVEPVSSATDGPTEWDSPTGPQGTSQSFSDIDAASNIDVVPESDEELSETTDDHQELISSTSLEQKESDQNIVSPKEEDNQASGLGLSTTSDQLPSQSQILTNEYTGTGADVELTVGSIKFIVNIYLLSAFSEYFRKLFFCDDTITAKIGPFKIDGNVTSLFDSPPFECVFEAFYKFLKAINEKTVTITIEDALVAHLLVFAKQVKCDYVRREIEKQLCSEFKRAKPASKRIKVLMKIAVENHFIELHYRCYRQVTTDEQLYNRFNQFLRRDWMTTWNFTKPIKSISYRRLQQSTYHNPNEDPDFFWQRELWETLGNGNLNNVSWLVQERRNSHKKILWYVGCDGYGLFNSPDWNLDVTMILSVRTKKYGPEDQELYYLISNKLKDENEEFVYSIKFGINGIWRFQRERIVVDQIYSNKYLLAYYSNFFEYLFKKENRHGHRLSVLQNDLTINYAELYEVEKYLNPFRANRCGTYFENQIQHMQPTRMFGLVTLWHKFGIDQLKRLLNVYFLTTRELMIYYGWKIRVKYDFYGYQEGELLLTPSSATGAESIPAKGQLAAKNRRTSNDEEAKLLLQFLEREKECNDELLREISDGGRVAQSKCTICKHAERNTMLINCKHYYMCENCSYKFKECSECQAKINGRITLFVAR